jgi:hypothetical protein
MGMKRALLSWSSGKDSAWLPLNWLPLNMKTAGECEQLAIADFKAKGCFGFAVRIHS